MSCLKDIQCGKRTIIGIKDFITCESPESALFIQDLPGITLRQAAMVASEEYESGAKLLHEKIKLATKLVYDDFQARIMDFYDFNAIVEERQTTNFFPETIAPVSTERGITVRRWRSEIGRIYIEKVMLRTVESGITNLRFKNAEGDTIKTVEVSLTANRTTTVRIDTQFEEEEIFIVFDQTNFTTYSYPIYQRAGACYSCAGTNGAKALYVAGWDGSKETSHPYGVGVWASVRCDVERIFCSVLPRLYMLLWYRSGIEFLNERIHSPRFNNLVLFDTARAKELRDEELWPLYQAQWKKTIPSLKQFIKQTKGECFTCQNHTHYVQQTP